MFKDEKEKAKKEKQTKKAHVPKGVGRKNSYARYRLEGRFERNMKRRIARHHRQHPNDFGSLNTTYRVRNGAAKGA